MTILTLYRLTEYSNATFGVLAVDGLPKYVTLERPWLGNEKKISCIPAGSYKLKQKFSPRFGATYEVEDVNNRSHILFHAGNTVEASLGCILVGTFFGRLNGKPGILRSKDAFESLLLDLRESKEVTLNIISMPGGQVQ
jgi:hypothetical protein